MKIGVVGPAESLELIQSVIKKDRIPIEVVELEYQVYTQAAAMVEQQQPFLDALFFAGPLPFRYVSNYVRPTIPWEYVPPNMLSVAYALIKATITEKANLSRISTDSYTRQMFSEAYEEIGIEIEDFTILCAADRIFREGYIDYLEEFHYNCYHSGQATCCITGICEVKQRLKQRGVPTAMVQISYETIALQINKLRLSYAERALSMGDGAMMAVIAVSVTLVEDHTIFSQSPIALLQRKNKIAEIVYTFAQTLGSAVVQDQEGRFFLFSSQKLLEIETENFHRIRLMDQLATTELVSQVYMGIGVGETSQLAKYHAETALRNAYSSRTTCSYLVRGQSIYGPIVPFSPAQPQAPTQQHLLSISKRAGISLRSLEQLELVIRQYGLEYVTPVQLSQLSGLSARNMNRILNRLEDAGFVTVVGKETRVDMGRPGRIIKIQFTE